ncbi:MAG: glycoside hydrolase family 2 protein [Chloroflexota bacterium]
MQKVSLNGAWELIQANDETVIPATVPGCVHTDLMANDMFPDYNYRDNEALMQWIGETDWTYRRTFTLTREFTRLKQVILRCEGLDTLATIRINGINVASTDNMFRTYEFDVKRVVRAGDNLIEITFRAPMPYLRQMDAENRAMVGWVDEARLNTGGWLRKQPSNFGWDWGPKLPTVGIWRGIELLGVEQGRITDVELIQSHKDTVVNVTVRISVQPRQRETVTAVIALARDGMTITDMRRITFDGDLIDATFTIKNPMYWYPNGMGDQPLYEVLIGLLDRELNQLDYHAMRFGIRTIELDRHEDAWGESFQFVVNGEPVFIKGANWIPAKPFPSAVTYNDYKHLLQMAKDANINMLRVWGGGIYESNEFYHLCDEMGIMIWQDFMFACGTYPSFDRNFLATVKAEAIDNIKRIRHHACLALWCGNNEIEQGMQTDNWYETVSWDDYSKLFDEMLPSLVDTYSDGVDYIPGSPHSPIGDRMDWQNPNWGDTHLWQVWHGHLPVEWYRTRFDRFISEFGFQSFPMPDVVHSFTEAQDRELLSPVMKHHQRSAIGNETITHYQQQWFRDPKDFNALLCLSQILQGMIIQYAVEHWRRNMPRTMGTLYWQYNDMWAAASWSALDWLGNKKALLYMTKRFYAPVLISGVEDAEANTVAIHLTSDLRVEKVGELSWHLTDTSGSVLAQSTEQVTIPVRESLIIETLDLSEHVARHGAENVMLWLAMRIEGAVVSENLVTLAKPKDLPLQSPTITVKSRELGGDRYEVVLETDQPALYVWLTLPNAQFSDNFFHLRPTQLKSLIMSAPAITNLQVNSLVDTYL